MTEPVFDLEMQAMARIEELLKPFEYRAQLSMLSWVQERLARAARDSHVANPQGEPK